MWDGLSCHCGRGQAAPGRTWPLFNPLGVNPGLRPTKIGLIFLLEEEAGGFFVWNWVGPCRGAMSMEVGVSVSAL
jgi:hypothetical protein